jgi:hypothetical protein
MLGGKRKRTQPALGGKETMDRLFGLDSMINPGLTPREFQELFAECHLCGLTMTQWTFQDHRCVMPESDTEPDVDIIGGDDEWV